MLAKMRAGLLATSITLVNAYLYDVFFPNYKSTCAQGCDSWSKHPDYFLHGKIPADAGSQCALVSGHADKGSPHGDGKVENSFLWPWCFCNGKATECQPAKRTVEQLNLQIASHDVLVAAFLTYESISGKPSAMLGTSNGSMQEVTGESHSFKSFSKGTSHSAYAMHYIPFRSLQPRKTYLYKVKSGPGNWSETFSFRMPGRSGETKLAIFGDMGVDKHNNMGNLKDDYESGAIDAILHMGDHAYDIQDNNDRTGDGYMNYFQPVLQQCPWLPIAGNHESRELKRFEAMAEGFVIGQKKANTADTLLGRHISLGNMLGAATHSSAPSGSPLYMSVDIGLVHVVAIDTKYDAAVLKAWVEKDLQAANANRGQVPWILVMNHYPGYIEGSSNDDEKDMIENASLEAYLSDEGEESEAMRYRTCDAMGQNASTCQTVGKWRAQVQDGLEPLYLKYGVDLVGGGHHHHYQATWPMSQSKLCQKNFDKPSCPVYFTEGGGGVPDRSSNACKPAAFKSEWVRVNYNNCGAYGRITATETTLRYDHVVNDNKKVVDTWTITKGSSSTSPMSAAPQTPAEVLGVNNQWGIELPKDVIQV
jgi:hypothetical protein